MNQSRLSSPQQAEIAVEVEIPAQFSAASSIASALKPVLTGALEAFLRSLGIAGTVALTVKEGPAEPSTEEALLIRVNGHRLRYSNDTPSLVSLYLGWPLEDIRRDVNRAVEYLTLLVAKAMRTRPDLLLGPGQMECYRQALRSAGARRAAESPWLEGALKLALRMWISIGDLAAVARAVESASADYEETGVSEAVVQALRPHDIEMHLSLDYLRELTGDDDGEWAKRFKSLRSTMEQELGVPVAPIRLVVDDMLDPTGVPQPRSFAFRINSLRTTPVRGLKAGELLANEIAPRVGVPGTPTINAANGWPATLVKSEHREQLNAAGISSWDGREFIVLCLDEALRRHAAKFLDQAVVTDLITQMAEQAPRLAELISALISTAEITALFRELLSDQISIRNARKICDVLADAESKAGLDERVSCIRVGVQREITNKLTRSTGMLPAYLLDLSIIDLLEHAATSGLDERAATAITAAIQTELSTLPGIAPPAIIATARIRAPLQELLRDVFPSVFVTTLEEIAPEAVVQPIARISV